MDVAGPLRRAATGVRCNNDRMHLELASEDFLNLRDVGIVGPWIEVLTFRVRGSGDDTAVLTELLASRWYDHSYAEPRREHPGPRFGLHGPYLLERISPSTFTPAGADEARARVRAWATQWDELPAPFTRRLDDLLGVALPDDATLYELPDIRAAAEHEWGGVVGFDGFHEFVAISAQRDGVTLLVASDD